MTKQQIAANAARLMHDAHLRYQRTMLKADHVELPCSEVRGVREARRVPQTWRPEWTTGLRPNFWTAYFDTLTYMSK